MAVIAVAAVHLDVVVGIVIEVEIEAAGTRVVRVVQETEG